MSWLRSILSSWMRERGIRAPGAEGDERRRPKRPPPTPTTRTPERPAPTPSTQRLKGVGQTAGTPSYSAPRGTPSTQRIHNPPRPGG